MNRTEAPAILLVGLGWLGGTIPCATADDFDQETTFTFSEPVEIPGRRVQRVRANSTA